MRRAPAAFVFFLGGYDLEMVTIRDLLATEEQSFCDQQLAWGAKASAYAAQIERALNTGHTPVLIELQPDLALADERVVILDHHGQRAGRARPTALEQVFALLHVPAERWTRWFALVSANDRGHVRAMRALDPPATPEELRRVRAADRAAQGITAVQEQQAARAIAGARILADGKLTVVDLPHDRVAAAADQLEPALGGAGYENLLVYTPRDVDFFGDGQVIAGLVQRYPGGWFGGSLPVYGFWGHAQARPTPEEVIALQQVWNHPQAKADED